MKIIRKWMENLRKKNTVDIAKLLLIMLGAICILKMYYTYCIRPDITADKAYFFVSASEEQIVATEQFMDESIIEQQIEVTHDYFSGFQLMFRKKEGGKSQPDVKVELLSEKDGQIIEKWNVDANTVVEYLYQDFKLQEPIENSMSQKYVIRVSSDDMEHIAPAVTNYNSYENGKLCIGNKVTEGSLVFSLSSSREFIKVLYAFFCIVVLCGVFLLWMLYHKGHKKEENYFLVLGIVWGVLFMAFFSPNTTPDERAHEATAYAKANSILGKEVLDSDGNVIVRESDAAIIDMNQVSYDTIEYIYNALRQKTNEERTSFVRGPLSGAPITAHFPQTLGIVVGWLLHANGMVTLYIGKIMALIFYLVCCYYSIKWIPWGKMVLMVVALFPMSLELAGSFSYDCTVNAVCFLFLAYVMKLIYEKKKAEWKDYIFLAILAVWMAPCKVVYVLVCGLVFAVPRVEKKILNKDSLGKILVFGAGIVAVFIQRISSICSVITVEQSTTNAKQGIEGYTLNYILSNPKQSIGVVFNTLFAQDEFLFGTTIGGYLGWLQVHVSWAIVSGFALILCVAVISDYNNRQCMSRGMRCLVIGLSFIIISAIAMSMWLDATPINLTYVEGIQGRYFLPILPMLMLTLKNNTIVVKKNITPILINGIFILELLTMFEVWSYIVW